MEDKKKIFVVDWKAKTKIYKNLDNYFEVYRYEEAGPKQFSPSHLEKLCDCLVIHPYYTNEYIKAVEKVKELGRPIIMVSTEDPKFCSLILGGYQNVTYCKRNEILSELKKIFSIK